MATTQNGELINRVQGLRLDNQLGAAKQGSGGASWLPWILCLIMALLWVTVGIRAYKAGGLAPMSAAQLGDGSSAAATNAAKSTPTSTSSTTPASAATTGTIAESGPIVLEQKGTLIPPQQIAVSPIDVGGRVVELNIVEGKSFKKGDVLARIEDTNYQAQVAEARSQLKASEQRLLASKLRLAELMPNSVRAVEVTQVEEELKEAEAAKARQADEVNRLDRLGASAAERETRQSRFDLQAQEARVRRLSATLAILKEGPRQERKLAAEADVATAQAEVSVSQARLDQSLWRIENCIIRAPIDGVALTKKAELGNLVNPLAFGSTSGSICDLANLADMEVELDVPEREIRKVYENQDATIKVEAYQDRTYRGYIARVMPIADDSKNVIKVRVKVVLPSDEIPGQYLKPKMGSVVTLFNRKYVATTSANSK
jgi:HlyD family secretion protein